MFFDSNAATRPANSNEFTQAKLGLEPNSAMGLLPDDVRACAQSACVVPPYRPSASNGPEDAQHLQRCPLEHVVRQHGVRLSRLEETADADDALAQFVPKLEMLEARLATATDHIPVIEVEVEVLTDAIVCADGGGNDVQADALSGHGTSDARHNLLQDRIQELEDENAYLTNLFLEREKDYEERLRAIESAMHPDPFRMDGRFQEFLHRLSQVERTAQNALGGHLELRDQLSNGTKRMQRLHEDSTLFLCKSES